MSLWRRRASEMLPARQTPIAGADNPYALWIELRDALNNLYQREPLDDGQISRIYDYAKWCLWQPCNDDLRTAVVVCFYEHLPTDGLIRADVARWLSVKEFAALRAVFGYHLSADEVAAFEAEFRARKAERPGRAGGHKR